MTSNLELAPVSGDRQLDSSAITGRAAVDLHWIPLGAGGHSVRFNGEVYEAVSALIDRRPRCDIYHSALTIRVPDGVFAVEMTPVPNRRGWERGRHQTCSRDAATTPPYRREQAQPRRRFRSPGGHACPWATGEQQHPQPALSTRPQHVRSRMPVPNPRPSSDHHRAVSSTITRRGGARHPTATNLPRTRTVIVRTAGFSREPHWDW
jgi:hypothetical protein